MIRADFRNILTLVWFFLKYFKAEMVNFWYFCIKKKEKKTLEKYLNKNVHKFIIIYLIIRF